MAAVDAATGLPDRMPPSPDAAAATDGAASANAATWRSKRNLCAACCPTVQQHTMAEAGGSRCLPARVLFAWRVVAGVALLVVPIVLTFALRRSFGDWIIFVLCGCTFLALAACSWHYAGGKEAPALSSIVTFFHTFAVTASAYFAPYYVYRAATGAPHNAVGVLPYAVYLADTLLMQAHLCPPFAYGVPALVFWYANLVLRVIFQHLGVLWAILFAAVAVAMLFFTIGVTRVFGLRHTPPPQVQNDIPLELDDEMWA